jgi:hypothetical protein
MAAGANILIQTWPAKYIKLIKLNKAAFYNLNNPLHKFNKFNNNKQPISIKGK